MLSTRALLIVTVSILPLLGGCDNQEHGLGMGGAAFGALACGVGVGALTHNAAASLGSAAACGLGGYFLGSAIGRRLDERDRATAQSATQQALAVPVTYRSTNVVRPPARPASWASDHTSNTRGSATVVAAQREPDGGECKTVREVAYIKGQEETQESRYCRGSDGAWAARQT